MFDPRTTQFNGRNFKNTGDGDLVEFGSAIDAVQCAVEIQRALALRNADLPEDLQIILRIGISPGDVIVEGDDLYGNGVNVAARMEGLAEPGEICVSATVHEHVGNALDIVFEDLGEQTVKNIDRSVRCYRVDPVSDGAAPARPADAPPSLPDKPSIAVLPFGNMSGDAEQEYFSDGITEDIITALSRIRQLFVIARNTTFTYKGRAVDVQAVARDLGVRYVLEGSVRKSGNRVRITTQLIDGATGNHLWAERYDRDLEDIFAVQDEITQVVAGAIEPEISKAEFERARLKPPDDPDAWSIYQQGMHHFYLGTDEGEDEARRLFETAIERAPGFSAAHASLARTYSRRASFTPGEDFDERKRVAIREARTAVSLDREDANAHTTLGFALESTAVDEAIASMERALALNPNSAFAHHGLGRMLVLVGQAQKGKSYVEEAIRLSPRDPMIGGRYWNLSTACFAVGDYAATVEFASRAKLAHQDSDALARALYVAALAHLGRDEEMRRERDVLLERAPGMTITRIRHAHPRIPDALVDALVMIGLPEE